MRESLSAKWACRQACEQNFNEIILFWDMMSYSMVKIYRHIGGLYCFHLSSFFYPEYGSQRIALYVGS
jgi:hypothetical protein